MTDTPRPAQTPVRRRLPPGARRTAVLDLLVLHPDGLSVADVARELGVHQNTVRTHLDVLVRTGRAERRTSPSGRPGRPSELYTATGAPVAERNYRLLAEMLVGRLTELADDPAREAVEAGRRWSAHHAPGTGGTGSNPHESNGTDPDPHDTDRTGPNPRDADGTAPDPSRARGAVVGPPTEGPPHPTPDRPLADEVRPVLAVLTAAGFAPKLDEAERRIDLHHCPFLELAVSAPDVVCGAHLGLIRGTLERTGATVDATRIVPFARPGVCVTELA